MKTKRLDVRRHDVPAWEVGTYLDVPYDEKDEAKAVGARFDAALKRWYAPAGEALRKYAKWLPAGSLLPGEKILAELPLNPAGTISWTVVLKSLSPLGQRSVVEFVVDETQRLIGPSRQRHLGTMTLNAADLRQLINGLTIALDALESDAGKRAGEEQVVYRRTTNAD